MNHRHSAGGPRLCRRRLSTVMKAQRYAPWWWYKNQSGIRDQQQYIQVQRELKERVNTRQSRQSTWKHISNKHVQDNALYRSLFYERCVQTASPWDLTWRECLCFNFFQWRACFPFPPPPLDEIIRNLGNSHSMNPQPRLLLSSYLVSLGNSPFSSKPRAFLHFSQCLIFLVPQRAQDLHLSMLPRKTKEKSKCEKIHKQLSTTRYVNIEYEHYKKQNHYSDSFKEKK